MRASFWSSVRLASVRMAASTEWVPLVVENCESSPSRRWAPLPTPSSATLPTTVKTWAANRADLARPIAAPLGRAAELLGVDLATVRRAARRVEPYRRADGEPIWSLHMLEVELKASVD
jgi:hypothetical protein